MRLTRKHELTVSMGPYETFKYGAEVSATHHDLGYTDEALAEIVAAGQIDVAKNLQDFVDGQLSLAVAQDVEDSADLTADKKSFILRAMREK